MQPAWSTPSCASSPARRRRAVRWSKPPTRSRNASAILNGLWSAGRRTTAAPPPSLSATTTRHLPSIPSSSRPQWQIASGTPAPPPAARPSSSPPAIPPPASSPPTPTPPPPIPHHPPRSSASPQTRTLHADATALPATEGLFDLILCDVPCSGTGTLSPQPEIRHRLQPADLARQATRQREILTAALARLAPGGHLLYSTCSLEPEENEQVIAATASPHHLCRHGTPLAVTELRRSPLASPRPCPLPPLPQS
jgi:hypothetical protein